MAAKMTFTMHHQRHSAPFYRVSRKFFLGFFAAAQLLAFDAAAEGGRNGDFPPETDYPDEAYESEDAGSQDRDKEYLQPKEVRDRKQEKKTRTVRERPKRVQKYEIEDEPPSTPAHWAFGVELGGGLNQITSSSDPDREAALVKDSLLLSGRVQAFRNAWGVEFDGKYSFTPIQEVTIVDASLTSTTQNRSVSSYSAFLNAAYRYGFAGPNGRFHLLGRVGYGWMGVTQQIEKTTGMTSHHAQSQAFYLGVGLEAKWRPYLSTQVDFYQSIIGDGRLAPVDSTTSSGYGFWSLQLRNQLRLGVWGEGDSQKSYGAGLTLALQGLKTPTPATDSKAGGTESFTQILVWGYLAF